MKAQNMGLCLRNAVVRCPRAPERCRRRDSAPEAPSEWPRFIESVGLCEVKTSMPLRRQVPP